jgi:TonB-linked SusC/RagA family outer membrane protein
MRKLTVFLVLLLFAGLQVVFAQKKVTGTVTTTDNIPLPGVTVVVKGTTTGTACDIDGKYSLMVPSDQSVLQFSFVSFKSQEIAVGGKTVIDVKLEEATEELSEVVVTALGIKRESKSLGYSVASVNTEELLESRTANVSESLVGKISGLNITAPAAGAGASTQIRLRGQVAFNGANNSPLIVINGLPIDQGARGANGVNQRDNGDNMNNINQDDIESMTVLKGATAAAIYGSRAANGAIIITTKTGQKGKGLGVEVNSSYTAQEVLDYFDFQQEYGQGTSGQKPTTSALAAGNGQLGWGARLDGSLVPIFDGTEQPYSPNPNRLKEYFNTGKNYTNTVAVSGGVAGGSFRASFSNTDASGIEPSNEYKRNIFNIGATYDITKRLKITTNINYTNEKYINPPQIGQQGAGSMNFFTRLATNIPLSAFRDHAVDPATGTERVSSGFQGTLLNPYYAMAAGQSWVNERDRFLGTTTLRYDITDWLYAQGRYNYDYSISFTENKVPGGIGTSVPTNLDGTYKGTYSLSEGYGTDVNADFLVGVSKRIKKFSVDASIGGNTFTTKNRNFNTNVSNFLIKDFFSVSNGVTKTPSFGYNKSRVNSLYGIAEFGYNSTFYLNFTGREDWFTVLALESNSKFYSSVSGSFVFSELLKDKPWISYGKLRGSWAQVGSANGVGTYEGDLTYSIAPNQFNGQSTVSISGSGVPVKNLQPFTVTEKEIGLEARLFNNKLRIDVAAFEKVTKDQILNVQLSEASSFSTSKKNLGSLKNMGIEAMVDYTPIQTKDFSWTTSWNNTFLKTEVLSVGVDYDGNPIKDLLVINFNNTGNEFLGELHYTVGMPMNQLYTRTYLRNEKGEILLKDNGFLVATPNYVPWGSSIPKHTGGWTNSFKYKNLSVGVFIDYKFGGKVMSATNLNATRQGFSKLSLEGRRIFDDGTVEDGLVFPGVYQSSGLPNTTKVTNLQNFYADYRNLQIGDPFVYKSDFIKLRSVSVSYDFTSLLKKLKANNYIKGLSLTASCRNVAILYKDLPNLDPEAVQSSGDERAGYENSALPTTRNYNFSLNVKF